MEDSNGGRDHPDRFYHRKRKNILSLDEILLPSNIAYAVGYGLLLYIYKNLSLWTPENDLPYYFFRGAYRFDDLLCIPSNEVITTTALARQFPSPWSLVGAELLIAISIFGLAALLHLLLRLVAGSWFYQRMLRRPGGVIALFAAPACYLLGRLTWTWPPVEYPLGFYPFWQSLPLAIFLMEFLCLGISAMIFSTRTIPVWILSIVLFIHYAFWLPVLWPRLGFYSSRLYIPNVLFLVFPASGIVWLVCSRMPYANSADMNNQKGVGRWIYVTAIFVLAVLLFAWLPSRPKSLTHLKNMESLTIQMSRGACYGRCPIYSITIHGNGSVDYAGYRYVDDRGPQTSAISREQVMTIIRGLDSAHFLTLEDRAFQWCFDSGSVAVSVSVDGKTKRVVSDDDCMGAKAGLQAQFVQTTREIDAVVGSKRWVECRGRCRE